MAAKQVNKEVFETMPVPQAVRQFVIPSLASTLITIIYSLADALFVGQLNDPNQLAGLTVAFPYYQLLNAFASLWGVGTNSVMSRSLGEKRYEHVSKASTYGFWGAVIFMACLCTIFGVLERPLLLFAGASSMTLGYASGYMTWTIIIGGIPTVLSIVMSNLLRAEGHAKKASHGLMLGGLLNCVLDPVFIFAFDMGVVGAAVATLISNCVSLVYFLLIYAKIQSTSYIVLNPFAHTHSGTTQSISSEGGRGSSQAEKRTIEWKTVGEIVLVGLPSCCLTILGVIGCIVQTSLYSRYNDEAVAAWGVVNRISFIGIYMTHGVGQGLLPLIGYNFGAKNYRRVREVNKWAIGIMLSIAFALLILSEAFSPFIMRIFTADAGTIESGTLIMRCYMLCTPMMGTILLISTLCQAVGKWQYSLAMLSIRQLCFNVPLTFLLNHLFGMIGVPLGQPTCEIFSLPIALFVYYRCFVRALKKDVG